MSGLGITALFAIAIMAASSTACAAFASPASPQPAAQASMSFVAGLPMDGQPMFLLTKSQGYLGVDIRDINDEQVSVLKLKEARGAEIITVDHDGPAAKAGLKLHDVVLQMNGQQVEGEDQLRRMLRETPAGRTVVFIISRDGQQQSVSVQLANRADVERHAWEQHFSVPEPSAGSQAGSGDAQSGVIPGSGFASNPSTASASPSGSSHGSNFLPMLSFHSSYTGAMVDNLSPQLAEFFGAKSGSGLLVKNVDADSPAATAGLKAGDVVLKVNSTEVSSPNDWLKTMRENKGKSVQITVLRNKQEQNLTLTPGSPRKKSQMEPLFPFGPDSPDSLDGVDAPAMVADMMPPDVSDLAPELPNLAPELDALRNQTEDLRQQLAQKLDSPEMKAQIEEFASELPDFKAQMETAQAQAEARAAEAKKLLDSPELKQQIEAAQAQAAKHAEGFINSPEFKQQIQAAQAQAEAARKQLDSPEFKQKMQHLRDQLQTLDDLDKLQ